ncbi:MAG TPA: peptidylprolyl isomerase [Aggregatilineales bacterium]|nr:peptidylprolyl isomerase [Aggregatilineales bacterium]
MSQKRKTTALPAPSARSGRRYLSRTERESQINRIVLIATAVIAVVIVLILVVALLADIVIAPNKAVASVAGQNITVRAFQNHVTYQRWRFGTQLANVQNSIPQQYLQTYLPQIFGSQQGPYAVYGQMYAQMSDPTQMGKSVLDDMVNQVLAEQYARANNITVDQKDIDKQFNDFFGYQPVPTTPTPTTTPSLTPTLLVSPTPTTTPTLTPVPSQTATPSPTSLPTGQPTATPGQTEQYKNYLDAQQKFFDQATKATGLSEGDIRQIFTEQALRQKVKDKITADVAVGLKEDQIKARHILVDSEDQAKDVMTALQNGESFAALAKAVSKDTSNSSLGGELGWKGRYTYVKEFEDAIWNKDTKVGAILGPIKTQFGYHVIQVEGHEVRAITDTEQQDAQTRTFSNFLSDLKDKSNVQEFDYISVTPSTPALSDFGIQEGLANQNGGFPAGFPGQ